MVTNVQPGDLNYRRYDANKYEQDIVRSIPGHEELHKIIGDIVCALAWW